MEWEILWMAIVHLKERESSMFGILFEYQCGTHFRNHLHLVIGIEHGFSSLKTVSVRAELLVHLCYLIAIVQVDHQCVNRSFIVVFNIGAICVSLEVTSCFEVRETFRLAQERLRTFHILGESNALVDALW